MLRAASLPRRPRCAAAASLIAPARALGRTLALGLAVALTVGLASCSARSSDAPPARRSNDQSGLQDLAEDLTANARLHADPCHAPTSHQLRSLGVPVRPSSRSVDFVAKRCRWSARGASLEVAVSTVSGPAAGAPAGQAVAVPAADRAVVVARPVLRDDAPEGGHLVRAVIARRGRRHVVVELSTTGGRTPPVTVLARIADAALRTR